MCVAGLMMVEETEVLKVFREKAGTPFRIEKQVVGSVFPTVFDGHIQVFTEPGEPSCHVVYDFGDRGARPHNSPLHLGMRYASSM